MELLNFSVENIGKIFYGQSFIPDLEQIFCQNDLENKKIVLMTGENFFINSKYFQLLKDLFGKYNIDIVGHISIPPNPTISAIKKEFTSIQNTNIDIIFAIGGGSVIDFAKAGKMFFLKKANIFTIYTRLGTASPVSPFTVYDTEEFKVGDFSWDIIPNITYISQEIIENIDDKGILEGLCDIYAHVLESYISKSATYESKVFAQRCFEILISEEKLLSIQTKQLVLADLYAGLSERVGVVLFPHAAGHYLTYKFGIPHPLANMIYLKGYFDILVSKNFEIPLQYLEVGNKIYSLLSQYDLLSGSYSFSTKEATHALEIIEKYMGFVFVNSPVCLNKDEYIQLLR